MGNTFSKMLLVSEEEMDRMKARQLREYNPSLKAMVKVQDQIESVLNDPSFTELHPNERLQILQNLQHRFHQLKNEPYVTHTPPPPATLTPTTNSPTPYAYAPSIKTEPTLYGISKQNVKKAEQLAEHLFKDPDVLSINDNNELVVSGKPISGSNVTDLLADVYTTSKSGLHGPRPVGYQPFLNAIRELHTPRTLLVNPAYRDEPIKEEPSSPTLTRSQTRSSRDSIFSTPTFATPSSTKATRALSLYKV